MPPLAGCTPWKRVLAPLLFVACARSPVDWTANRTVSTHGDAAALAADGVIIADTLVRLASTLSPPAPACAGSLRLAVARGTIYAAWWSPRSDSGARLLSARSRDGGTSWGVVATVDTTDRGRTGCRRAPPAVAADSASGYVHISYAMLAPEGPGLFFAHSMDNGVTFHTPVPILYGAGLGRTSVAASGDLVIVAFEDPNSSSPRVGLALSRTMGHIFEDRVLPVSDDHGRATQPLVAIGGRRMAVAWREREGVRGEVVFRVRTGTVR